MNRNALFFWLTFGLAAALYIVTAAPSIATLFDDSLEFQLVGPTFGIAHPTGYPLYILLSGLWSRVLLPLGNWAWRMNLFSALTGAAAVAGVFLLARHLTSHAANSRWLSPNLSALAAAVSFALGPVWWSQTTVAEVYALHGLFAAAILYTTVRIGQATNQPITQFTNQPINQSTNQPTSPPYRTVTLLCLLIGLSLAHHRTTVLLLPGMALYLLWRAPTLFRPQRTWIAWGLAILTPLLLYLYIPLRAALGVQDLNASYVNTWRGFWDHVLARRYAAFFQENRLAVTRTATDWLTLFQRQFGTLGLLLGALGLLQLVRRRDRPEWLLILLIGVSHVLFALFYRVPDVEVFLIPAFLCGSLLIGGGVSLVTEQAAQWLSSVIQRREIPRERWRTSIQVLLLTGLLFGLGGRGPAINRSQDWAAHDYAVELAKVEFPPDSRVVGLEGEITALRYMQAAAGLGTEAAGVVADAPEFRKEIVHKLMVDGLPVFLTRELDGIGTRYSFSGAGPLVRVWPRGAAQVGPPTQTLDLSFAEERLRLEGIDLDVLAQAGGPALRAAFYWRPVQPLEQRIKVSLRLTDADANPYHWPDGSPIQADQFPLRQAAYSDQWVTGELIRDVHYLAIPPQLFDGAFTQPVWLQVVVYDAASIAELGRWFIPLP